MIAFDYERPTTVSEAVSLLQKEGNAARVLAGGTDLIVQVREGRRDINLMVDGKGIPELTGISFSSDSGLELGASAPCYQIYGKGDVFAAYPGLMDAVTLIGGTAIQGRASLGGNLCNSSPAADSISPLIVHNSVAVIAGPDGNREVAVEDFCTGPGQNVLQEGELLVSLKVPAPKPNFGAHYLRFIPRNEMDIAVVGAGASVELDEDGETIQSARIALCAVAPTPLLVSTAGDSLAGQKISDEAIEQAAQLAKEAAKPISDMRGSAAQRKHLSAVLTRRALEGAIRRAQNGSA